VRHSVYAQVWIESERGWGTRPDGYSLHLTRSDVSTYIQKYWDKMPNSVPDEYSRPEGDPTLVEIDTDLYEQVRRSIDGIKVDHF